MVRVEGICRLFTRSSHPQRLQIMPLLSRTLDPLLGVFTGVLAYYLAEKNPRTAPPQGETLVELLRWKRDKWLTQQSKPEELVKS